MKYFLYGPFSPALQKPVIVSLALHLLIMLLAAFGSDPYPDRTFQVELAASVDREVELQEQDIELQPDKSQVQSQEEVETHGQKMTPESISQNALHREVQKNNATESLGDDSEFMKEYEEQLFQRNNSGSQRELSAEESALDWDVEKAVATAGGKTRTLESLPAPSGGARTGKVTWKDGSARKIITQPEFDYPELYRRQGIQGKTILGIEVDSGGNVVFVEIIKSSGHSKLDLLATQGVRKTKFSPKGGGDGVDSGEIEVRFELAR